jgi:hypothetical protein
MIKTVPLMAAACLSISLFSCSTGKNLTEVLPLKNEAVNAENPCFIKFADGTVKQYSSLKLVTGLFKEPHLLADDNVVIKTEIVKAYQSKDCYAVCQKDFAPSINSHVAKNALPGFAVRIVKGRINVFSIKYYNGHNTTEKLFMQTGEEGEVIPCSKKIIADIVKENIEAVALLQSDTKPITESKRVIAAIMAYNNSSLISKN